MKRNKLMAVLLCLCVVASAFVLAACGDSSGDSDTSGETESAENISEESQACSEEFPADETNSAFTALAQEIKATWDELYQYGALSIGKPGDTMQNAFFTWTVNRVETTTNLEGTEAGDGYKFVVVNLTMTNTTDYEFESGNYEFLGLIGADEDGELNTEDAFYDDMLADEFNLGAGESITGDIVFKVPAETSEIIVDYESIYEGEMVDGTNWVDVTL